MTREFDPVKLSVLANAFDGIVREMTSGLLRSARSSVINTARDFSCAVLTADNQLLAAAEGVPVHVFGAGPLGEDMVELHKDIREGDAFLHNDPYMGNSHAADHVILVPIFIQGRHLFTAVTKAHQADCGNSLPTTFFATARDVYEEGALIFPCVRIQRDYTDIDDIIRMCRSRIRVPDQWYGDYLASVGASRIAERRIHELAEKFGVDDLVDFVDAWFDYSERLTASAIEKLPEYILHGTSAHDPFPGTGPGGVQLQATLEVKPKQGKVVIDLRNNPDNLPNGLNLTKQRQPVRHWPAFFPASRKTCRATPELSAALRCCCATAAPSEFPSTPTPAPQAPPTWQTASSTSSRPPSPRSTTATELPKVLPVKRRPSR